MKHHLLAAVAALALMGTAAIAQDANADNTMAADNAMAMDPATAEAVQQASAVTDAATFVTKATVGNLFEIQSSQAALQKGSTDAVKTFAQKMIDDHTKADMDLKTAVASSGTNVAIPTGLDPDHQKKLDDLNALSGAEFDAKYVELQKGAHAEAVALFTSYSTAGDNETLKAFAAMTLPTLEMHKMMIDAM